MKSFPCAILVVTSTVTDPSAKKIEAMRAGALDVIAAPIVCKEEESKGGDKLIQKITRIGRILGITKNKKSHQDKSDNTFKNRNLLAIGCSTGGPNALLKILLGFSKNLDCAMVIIQHMNSKFIPSMADWLKKQINLSVPLIEDNESPRNNSVLFSYSYEHILMKLGCRMYYTQEPLDNS